MTDSTAPNSSRAIAFVACRAIALYVLYVGLQNFFFSLSALVGWNEPDASAQTLTFATVHIGFFGFAFSILWFGAQGLSAKMAPINTNIHPQDLPNSNFAQVAVAVLGLFFILSAFAQLPGLVVMAYHDGNVQRPDQAFEAAAKLILGVAVFLGARQITAIIKRSRFIGT